jgi:hypothetical protein
LLFLLHRAGIEHVDRIATRFGENLIDHDDQKAISNKLFSDLLFGFRIEVLRFFFGFRASDFEF